MRRFPGALVAVMGVTGCRLGSPTDLVSSVATTAPKEPIGTLFALTGAACKTTYAASASGHVVYTSESLGHIYRVEARSGAAVEDLSVELDRVSTGKDAAVNVSPDGEWLIVATTRFGCNGDCLAIVGQNACSGQAIVDPTGNAIEAGGFPAIATMENGDLVVVYPLDSSGGRTDLYAIREHASVWSAAVNLTHASTLPFNEIPTLSANGSTVLFDCGTNSYAGGTGTSICEVATDGTGFRVVHGPADGPPGGGSWPLHKANYAPDGAIVFEGEWPKGGERIWQYPASSTTPAMVNDQTDASGNVIFNDDNTPCVLPDGRIVSLWLQRQGNIKGDHEIKVMNADGTTPEMLVIGENTLDVGHGCSK